MSMSSCLNLRKYRDSDCEILSELFYETVHNVNAKDYTKVQLCAWARDKYVLAARRADLSAQNTLIAEVNGKIAGFASMDEYGCLDLLYVHKDFQHNGIATALCDELEKGFQTVVTFASVTAKPFFEKRGYEEVKAREAERGGVKLKNYEMRKRRSECATGGGGKAE